MRYGSFTSDTRYNIFRGGPSRILDYGVISFDHVLTNTIDSVGLLSRTLQEKDGPAWMFLPQDEIVKKYYDVQVPIPQDSGSLKVDRRMFPYLEVGRA